jgi:hypothetical protein
MRYILKTRGDETHVDMSAFLRDRTLDTSFGFSDVLPTVEFGFGSSVPLLFLVFILGASVSAQIT